MSVARRRLGTHHSRLLALLGLLLAGCAAVGVAAPVSAGAGAVFQHPLRPAAAGVATTAPGPMGYTSPATWRTPTA